MKDSFILWCDGQKADTFSSLNALRKCVNGLAETIRHAEYISGEKVKGNFWEWSINYGVRIPIKLHGDARKI